MEFYTTEGKIAFQKTQKQGSESPLCDTYAYAIKANHSHFIGWKTVRHVKFPCEISRYVYFFIEEENGNVFGTLKSLIYKVSPIPSGG